MLDRIKNIYTRNKLQTFNVNEQIKKMRTNGKNT